ncbi:hypothetical protein ACRYHF_15150 [Stutzerimonas balearica]|uniref:hypothetical protein n=1 Tax=Stutzerimonas balearica TaxID=74829 RepID=UPI003F5C43B5
MKKQTQILRLVQVLEDELDQFPLSSVIRSHAELTEQALDASSNRLLDIGQPGRKFWGHPAELMYDEVGVLLGAMFVLIQAAITETVSIVIRIYELNEQKINKSAVMSLESNLDSQSNLSHVAIANGAANYYKHCFESPNDWRAITRHDHSYPSTRNEPRTRSGGQPIFRRPRHRKLT